MKQTIVVNEALKLPRGKLAVQVAHAALAAFLNAPPDARQSWLQAGMPKVVLRSESASELHRLESQANRLGLPVAIITDAGHTVVRPGTATCVGIGPVEDETIDTLTKGMKLVR